MVLIVHHIIYCTQASDLEEHTDYYEEEKQAALSHTASPQSLFLGSDPVLLKRVIINTQRLVLSIMKSINASL